MALPLILVTSSTRVSARLYGERVESRGARVRLALPEAMPEALMAGATALMLTGGPDVSPALYGEAPDPNAGLKVDRRLDDMELALLRLALERDLPVLAICRGMQLLNVAFGGKLIQDLPGHIEKEGESAYHLTYLSPGSKLAAILGSGGFLRLNSRHHQGLREAQKAPALLATAYAVEDGLIEALESPAHDWVIGLQCHPEREQEVPKSLGRLFQALVERAESRLSLLAFLASLCYTCDPGRHARKHAR